MVNVEVENDGVLRNTDEDPKVKSPTSPTSSTSEPSSDQQCSDTEKKEEGTKRDALPSEIPSEIDKARVRALNRRFGNEAL